MSELLKPSLMGLLQDPAFMAGMGLLSANARSRTPPNYAQGLLGGLGGAAQMQQQQEENEIRKLLYSTQLARFMKPKEPKETDVMANARAMGLQPGTPEYNAFIKSTAATNAPAKPADIQEYEYAQAQGFKGTLQDWMLMSTQQRAAYFTFIPTAKGIYKGDARTGDLSLAPIGGVPQTRPVLTPTTDPSLKEEMARAEMAGQSEAKRTFNMTGIGSIIDEARTVLKTDKPTASGAGTAWDTVAGWAGITAEGASEADKMRAIGGALVAKMPRMEGPQSDFDVENYKQMAGEIGNSNLPIERRMAALDQVEKIWRKYEHLNSAPRPASQTIPGRAPTIDDRLKKYGL